MNHDTALRPRTFADYIGQPAAIARLRIIVGAAKARHESVPHTLVSGPAGLGKTSLAYVIANEIGARAHIAMGPNLEKSADVHALLARLAPGDVLFIDEIHSVPPLVTEALFPAMEDRKMMISLNCGTYSRPATVDLPPFTLVAATTMPGLLQSPLRDRFGGASLALEFYSVADLTTILTANAHKLNLAFEPDALSVIAGRSRGTPRVGNNLLRFARDYAAVEGGGMLTVGVAEAALSLAGVDSLGLTPQDRLYLTIMRDSYNGGPVGVDALAATMGLKADTLSSVIEPYALRLGLIARTARGRCVTDKGITHLQKSAAA